MFTIIGRCKKHPQHSFINCVLCAQEKRRKANQGKRKNKKKNKINEI